MFPFLVLFGASGKVRHRANGKWAYTSSCCCRVPCDSDIPCYDDELVTIRVMPQHDDTQDPENPVHEPFQECCPQIANDYPCSRVGQCHWHYGPSPYCTNTGTGTQGSLLIEIDVIVLLEIPADPGPPYVPAQYKLQATVTVYLGSLWLYEIVMESGFFCLTSRTQWQNLPMVFTLYTENDDARDPVTLIKYIDCTDPGDPAGIFNPTA